MHRFWTESQIFVLIFLLTSCTENFSIKKPVPIIKESGSIVDIKRDDHGFPHIFAQNEEAAYYGLGYIQAKDHRAELMLRLALSSGHVASTFPNSILKHATVGTVPWAHRFGLDDMPLPGGLNPTLPTVVDLDKTSRYYGYLETAEKILAELSTQDRGNLKAFVRGINDSVIAHKAQWKTVDNRYIALDQMGLFDYQVMERDVVLVTLDLFSWGMIIMNQGQIDALYEKDLETQLKFSGKKKRAIASIEFKNKVATLSRARPRYTSSNQWAFLGGLTQLSKTRHVIDPHIPMFDERYKIYGVVIDVAGKILAGSALTGFPYLILGMNNDIAWSHTAHHDGILSTWSYEMDPNNSEKYKTYRHKSFQNYEVQNYLITDLNGKKAPFKVRKGTHGTVLYRSLLGLTGFSFKMAKDGYYNTIKDYYQLSRAKNVQEARAAFANQNIPTFNTIITDEDEMYFVYNTLVHRRDDSLDWSKIQSAMDAKTEWGPLHAFKDLPQVTKTSDYLVNCNVSPSMIHETDSGIDLSKYPKYMIYSNTEPVVTYRQQNAFAALKEKLIGRREPLTKEEIFSLVTDERSYFYVEFLEKIQKTLAAWKSAAHSSQYRISAADMDVIENEIQSWIKWWGNSIPVLRKEDTVLPRIELYRQNGLKSPLMKTRPKISELMIGMGKYNPDKIEALPEADAFIALKWVKDTVKQVKRLGWKTTTWGELHRFFNLKDSFGLGGGMSLRATGPDFFDGQYFVTAGGQTWVQYVEHGDNPKSYFIKPIWGPYNTKVPWYSNVSQAFSEVRFESMYIGKDELVDDRIVESIRIQFTKE